MDGLTRREFLNTGVALGSGVAVTTKPGEAQGLRSADLLISGPDIVTYVTKPRRDLFIMRGLQMAVRDPASAPTPAEVATR